VNDAAVACAGGHAEARKLLDDENILPAARNGFGDGATDDATTDNEDINLVHKETEYTIGVGGNQ
jgi:hypothetical protein